MRNLTRKVCFVGFTLAILAAMATSASANELIGTYTIDYLYNAAGCIDGYPNNVTPSSGNPYFCSYESPGPIVIDATPGDYEVVTVGLSPVCCGSPNVWAGNASGGVRYPIESVLNSTVNFDLISGQIVLYAWDWYPFDNNPSISTTVALYSTASATPEPSSFVLLETAIGLMAALLWLKRRSRAPRPILP